MTKSLISAAAMAVVCMLSAGDAEARSEYMSLLPSTIDSCGVCHTSSRGGGSRNSFGRAFQDAGFSFTNALCNADSDGDGYVNGVELGDPMCVWRNSQPWRTALSNPGVASKTPCGNGTIEGPEVCDGAELGGATCESQGREAGTIRCAASCKTFELSGCGGAVDMGMPDMAGPPDMDVVPDMAPPVDMDTAPDMDVAPDMAAPDMAALDMAAPGEDMDIVSAPDMGGAGDMADPDLVITNPDTDAEEESCAQGGAARPAGGLAGGWLVLLGLLGLARRRQRIL
jgi:hypothetical protein